MIQLQCWIQEISNMKTYQNLCALYYDLDKPDAPADALGFYLEYAKNTNGPIFEPMCGTGRFLIPMPQRGFDIEGSDASTFMLSIVSAKQNDEKIVLDTVSSYDEKSQIMKNIR